MSDMMWGGRFTKAEEKNALDFNASISYDCRMYREDIAGSIAHAKMLAAHGIISKEDQEKITKGLLSIKKEIDEGTFPFSVELEDIHMNIEKRLTEEIGDAGARLHTARSRNDQCELDLHMYMKRNIARLSEKLIAVLEALLAASKKYQDVIKAVMSGYSLFPQVSPATGENTMADTEKLARLSHREMLVMKYLINGLSNKEIAETLSLSEKTISTYKTRLYTKLNVSNLLELADVASRYEKT